MAEKGLCMKPIVANAPHNMLAKKEKPNKYAVSNYDFDVDNPEDSHSILCKNALGAKNILDVGCGVGYIGKKLKELQKCIVDGIEFDTESAKIASRTYDNVMIMQVGNPADQEFQKFLKSKRRYDCIICGDIIEHLVNPAYVLSVLAKKLNAEGKIVVSIPNLAHIDVIAGLIDGKFNYATCGILDSTHLRFWTESSFYEFIKNTDERYSLNLCPRLIAKTHTESAIYDSSPLRAACGDECIAFQNIFVLENNGKSFPKVKPAENYSKVAKMLSEAEHVEELQRKIKDMEQSISWKITAPLRKINAKFKR